MITEIKAYAKINLNLEVNNHRSDGYHNIFSLMANIDLYDLLKLEDARVIEFRDSDIRISVTGGRYKGALDSLSTGNNLISRAGKEYLKHIKASASVHFSLLKDIPVGSGLGGGSADAAAAIKLINGYINKETDKGLTNLGLIGIGAKVGADVPFCLTGGFAFCEGTGDIIESTWSSLNDYWLLIVNNGIHIDTAWAYKSLERGSESRIGPEEIQLRKDRISNAIESGDIDEMSKCLTNDFEVPVFNKYPDIAKLKKRIMKLGARLSIMTGTGSTLVGFYSDEEKANKAKDILKDEVEMALLTKFI
ncbi:4-(cytidine 5'-diphospho)-2-C-methyl-D-erythritol kinase [Spirochaetota bacterium]